MSEVGFFGENRLQAIANFTKKPSSVACNTDNKIYVQGAAYAQGIYIAGHITLAFPKVWK